MDGAMKHAVDFAIVALGIVVLMAIAYWFADHLTVATR
jgi:hypothetical protein